MPMPSADRTFPRDPRIAPYKIVGEAPRVGVVAGPGGVMLTVDHDTALLLLEGVRRAADMHERLHEAMESDEGRSRTASASHRLRAVEEALIEAVNQVPGWGLA